MSKSKDWYEWRKLPKEMPSEKGVYLIAQNGLTIRVADFVTPNITFKDGKWTDHFQKESLSLSGVTHWMPLPPPPRHSK